MNESSGEVAGRWYCRWTVLLRLKIQKFEEGLCGLGISALVLWRLERQKRALVCDGSNPSSFCGRTCSLSRDRIIVHTRGSASGCMKTTQLPKMMPDAHIREWIPGLTRTEPLGRRIEGCITLAGYTEDQRLSISHRSGQL